MFLLEIVDSSGRIKNVTKLQGQWWKSVTSVRSGKFPRLRFSAKCPSYCWLPPSCTTLHLFLPPKFAQGDSRSSALIFPHCSRHMWVVNFAPFYTPLSVSLDQSDRTAIRITPFVLLRNPAATRYFRYLGILAYASAGSPSFYCAAEFSRDLVQ